MWLTHISAALVAFSGTANAIGLHGAIENLLQVTPSFSSDGIVLHPGWLPGHDPGLLEHLLPALTKTLHYTQEGHRPSLHGAKHASLDATFTRNTVVLDHSSHIKSITCEDGDIEICFKTPHALRMAEDTWTSDLTLVTYHVGCGDVRSGKRSFFHATRPMISADSMCAVMAVIPIEEDKALESGVVTWGTYESPDERKRSMSPAKGHVRVARPPPITPRAVYRAGKTHGRNGTMPLGNGTAENPYAFEDITTNPAALYDFFNTTDIDTSDMEEEVDYLDLMPMDGDMNDMNSTEMGGTSTSLSKRRVSAVAKRGIFADIWAGMKKVARWIVDAFDSAARFVSGVARFVIEVAIVTAKLIMVPFGVPFDHSIHYDVEIDEHLNETSISNKPPNIFGFGNGFTLAKTVDEGVEFTVQCAKCGIHAKFNVNGRLAFSIKEGVTEGYVEFVNEDPFTLDAIFGISLYGKLATQEWKTPLKDRNGRQLQAVPFSPLTIPGIITLGPQASVSVAFTATLEGKLELLVGGSLEIAPGHARASVKDEETNGIKGLEVKFNPVFRANGTFTATGDLGLPIALECGIDVLNGKFKKTVGLIDTPSIYVQAIANRADDGSVPCNNGVELRVGAKNRIHVAALDMWDYDLRDDIIYEAGIGCVSPDGWSSSDVQPSKGIISDIIGKSEGGDVTNKTQKLNDVATKMEKPKETNAGFRLVMDGESKSILVSGEDGYIYLADTDTGYDLSAPWGTTDMKHNTLMLDVFGRLVAYRGITQGDFPALAEIMVVDPAHVPVGFRASAIAEMDPAPEGVEPEQTDRKLYSVPYVLSEDKKRKKNPHWTPPIAYPTFCKTDKGLRLFTTRFLFDKDGYPLLPTQRSPDGEVTEFYDEAFERVGIKRADCRTVQLTSRPK